VEQKGNSGMEDRKIAIITGASSGLGAEYARLLDKEGLAEIWLSMLPVRHSCCPTAGH